jgi:hypothetical protein
MRFANFSSFAISQCTLVRAELFQKRKQIVSKNWQKKLQLYWKIGVYLLRYKIIA